MGSQAQLGVMYFKGQGVAQDYVYAHMWLNLAAAQGEINAAEIRDILSKTMLPVDVSMAQRMAREWLEKRCNVD